MALAVGLGFSAVMNSACSGGGALCLEFFALAFGIYVLRSLLLVSPLLLVLPPVVLLLFRLRLPLLVLLVVGVMIPVLV